MAITSLASKRMSRSKASPTCRFSRGRSNCWLTAKSGLATQCSAFSRPAGSVVLKLVEGLYSSPSTSPASPLLTCSCRRTGGMVKSPGRWGYTSRLQRWITQLLPPRFSLALLANCSVCRITSPGTSGIPRRVPPVNQRSVAMVRFRVSFCPGTSTPSGEMSASTCSRPSDCRSSSGLALAGWTAQQSSANRQSQAPLRVTVAPPARIPTVAIAC